MGAERMPCQRRMDALCLQPPVQQTRHRRRFHDPGDPATSGGVMLMPFGQSPHRPETQDPLVK